MTIESMEETYIRLLERIGLLESALRDAIKMFSGLDDYPGLLDAWDDYQAQYEELIEELKIEDDD